jgi:hypothetical protein
MNQRIHVRKLRVCPLCNKPKDTGLVLCWPCHNKEKEENDGCYSARTERILDTLDSFAEKVHVS